VVAVAVVRVAVPGQAGSPGSASVGGPLGGGSATLGLASFALGLGGSPLRLRRAALAALGALARFVVALLGPSVLPLVAIQLGVGSSGAVSQMVVVRRCGAGSRGERDCEGEGEDGSEGFARVHGCLLAVAGLGSV